MSKLPLRQFQPYSPKLSNYKKSRTRPRGSPSAKAGHTQPIRTGYPVSSRNVSAAYNRFAALQAQTSTDQHSGSGFESDDGSKGPGTTWQEQTANEDRT